DEAEEDDRPPGRLLADEPAAVAAAGLLQGHGAPAAVPADLRDGLDRLRALGALLVAARRGLAALRARRGALRGTRGTQDLAHETTPRPRVMISSASRR